MPPHPIIPQGLVLSGMEMSPTVTNNFKIRKWFVCRGANF